MDDAKTPPENAAPESPPTPHAPVSDPAGFPEPSSAPAADPSAPGASEEAARSSNRNRLRFVALGSAVVGMVLGAVVEMFVQGAMESTGWFGPTMDTLIADQKSNFEDLRSKLDALRSTTDPEERKRLERELETLISAQEKLATRTHLEIRDYEQQMRSLKEQLLAAGGGVGGADFWLAEGESAAVGARANVVGVINIPSTSAYVQANVIGKRVTLHPGDAVDIPLADGTARLIFKQVKEKRAGFDYVPPDA